MKWYVEEKRFNSAWTPVVYHGSKPTAKRATSCVAFRFDPIMLPDCLEGLSIAELRDVLSPDGITRTHRTKEIGHASTAT